MHVDSNQLKSFLEDSDFIDNKKLEKAFKKAEKTGTYLGVAEDKISVAYGVIYQL
jgi:hypothetical protein